MTQPDINASDTAGPDLDTIEALLDVTYTWGYEETREKLRNLYVKATRSQWISDDVLAWDTDVDNERKMGPDHLLPLYGSDIYNKLTDKERTRLNQETQGWSLSQFLHGEQGALLAAAQLVNSVETLDGKLYSGTQVVDEARHVDVFNRYLHEKWQISYPINPHLRTLLDMILKDSRWDMKFLGMQIMVEGLALAAFGMIRQFTTEPLLRDLTTYVMQDEARHVAFGILSLRDFYDDMKESDRREREDFVYEASILMRDRFLFQEVWEKQGLPVEECKQITLNNQMQKVFRQLLFSKIVPAVKRLGLLSDRMRERFSQLDILQYEDWVDAEQEQALQEAGAPQAA